VFKGKNNFTGEDVAIKVINKKNIKVTTPDSKWLLVMLTGIYLAQGGGTLDQRSENYEEIASS
jgi:hypothetical protein